MQNVVLPTLVVTATTFGLGAEIQSLTGLSLSVCLSVSARIQPDLGTTCFLITEQYT